MTFSWADVWEFFYDSIAFLDECKYKSVSKYLLAAWEKEMAPRGILKSMSHELVKVGKSNQMHVLIRLNVDGPSDVSIWLKNHKTRFEELKSHLHDYEKKAREAMQNES